MTIPWGDDVTASIDGPHGREVLIQAPLKIVVPFLAARPPAERSSIVLAFADRSSPPYRYDGGDIVPLLGQLQRRRAMARARGELD
jgi:hypothetical protein